MSVNMFRLRFTTERHALAKKIPPAHSTTGVARMNSIHLETFFGMSAPMWTPGIMCPIAMKSTGSVSVSAIQNLRDSARISASSPSSPVTVFGSSGIPHFGQSPG